MSRNDLLENDYYFELKEPKKAIINTIWLFWALVFIAISLLLFLAIYIDSFYNISIPYIDFDGYVINIIFIATPFIYFIFKDILTHLFCSNKKINTEAKLSTKTEIPLWNCREAFKTWQILLIYLTPTAFIYPILLGLGLISGGEINILIVLFIMSFFMSHDLTLVIYVLFLKTRYKAEYISINNHLYSVSLFSRKNNINEKVDDINIIQDKINKKYFRKTKFFTTKRLSVIKKVSAILICVCLISGVVIYINLNYEKEYNIYNPDDFNTYLEYCNSMNAVIKKYKGDIFSDIYHTAGDETGCEYLVDHNIIYCNDDGSVIYFDSEKDSIMRLDYEDKTERLCIYEDCRENLDKSCGHMIHFVSNGCYSEGVLYGAQSYSYVDKKYGELLKCYILRYDIEKNKMDKLIEFEIEEENAYIHKMFISSGFLYAVVSADDMAQLIVARIDLEKEVACIVYSDNKDLSNKEKIKKLMYNKNSIFSVEDGMIYECGSDMAKFTELTSFHYGQKLYIYTHAPDIYYMADDRFYGYIYNDDKKAYSTEFLLGDIDSFKNRREIYTWFLHRR
jgi:hypothetical protein